VEHIQVMAEVMAGLVAARTQVVAAAALAGILVLAGLAGLTLVLVLAALAALAVAAGHFHVRITVASQAVVVAAVA
jgi:hypothetical protein